MIIKIKFTNVWGQKILCKTSANVG
jgi:hypothetical protein